MKNNKLTINIDPKLHNDFKAICVMNDVSIKDIVTQFIEEFNKKYVHNLQTKRVQDELF